MNERIKALAEQALGTRKYVPAVWQFYDNELKNFAELIVKECIKVHKDDYGVDIIGDVLKKHFGVEE